MDSRIREIEQWVTEAKTDLGEHGREAYLNKLYLLDAEIRSVIRESGMHPSAASPQPKGRRVRRLHAGPVFASGALGMLLLAVSAVYFASPGLSLPLRGSQLASAPATTMDYLPVPQGEELVIDPAGATYLNTLPGSPSEEKAGEITPSVSQASAAGTAVSPVSSKPSALAQTPPQASATVLAKDKLPVKPGIKTVLAGNPAQPVDAKSKPLAPPVLDEAVQVIPSASPAAVDKTVVDSGDKLKVLDTDALAEQLDSELS